MVICRACSLWKVASVSRLAGLAIRVSWSDVAESGYLEVRLLADLRPVGRPAVAPEGFLALVLPLNWEAFFAITGMEPRTFVVAAAFRLLLLSLAILNCHTFFPG